MQKADFVVDFPDLEDKETRRFKELLAAIDGNETWLQGQRVVVHPKKENQIHLVILVWGALITSVEPFSDRDRAEKYFKKHVRTDYSDYVRRRKLGESAAAILGKWEGSQLYTLEVQ